MALDEALLVSNGPPTLRLYRWRPHGLSLGYFQRHDSVDAGRLGRDGIPIVRRLTGGGAILHGDEITFSITAPAAHPLFAGPVRASYDRVHAVLALALHRCGAAAAPRGDASLLSDERESPWCFFASTEFDLAADGRKLVGSAQRRTGGRVLHHGSIVLRANAYTPGSASLDALDAESRPEVVEGILFATFAEALDADLVEAPPTDAERELAARLIESRYANEAWTRRR